MNIILENAVADPHYAPYCLRCVRLVRMVRSAPFLWTCRCGAVCDVRKEARGRAESEGDCEDDR